MTISEFMGLRPGDRVKRVKPACHGIYLTGGKIYRVAGERDKDVA